MKNPRNPLPVSEPGSIPLVQETRLEELEKQAAFWPGIPSSSSRTWGAAWREAVSSESARRVILETLPRELSVQPGTEHDGGERVDHARHAEHPGTLSCMVRDLPHQGPLQLRTTTVDLKCPPLPYWRGVLEMLLSSLVRLDSRTTTSEVTNIGETGT